MQLGECVQLKVEWWRSHVARPGGLAQTIFTRRSELGVSNGDLALTLLFLSRQPHATHITHASSES